MTIIKDRRLRDGFTANMAVEVQIADDDKLAGAWFEAKILEVGSAGKQFYVEYAELYTDEEQTQKEQEWILLQNIRPTPPPTQVKIDDLISVKVGDAVEMLVDDGWWEGIVHQIEADGTITTHFPETNSFEIINQEQHDDLSKESKRLRKGLKFKDGIWCSKMTPEMLMARKNQINRVGGHSFQRSSFQKNAGTPCAYKIMNKTQYQGGSSVARDLPSDDEEPQGMERSNGIVLNQKVNIDDVNKNTQVGKQNCSVASAQKRPVAPSSNGMLNQERIQNKKIKTQCDKPKSIQCQQQQPPIKRTTSCQGDIVAQRNRQNNIIQNKQMQANAQRPISAQHQAPQQQNPNAQRPIIIPKPKNRTINKNLINVKKESNDQKPTIQSNEKADTKPLMNQKKDFNNPQPSSQNDGHKDRQTFSKFIQRHKSSNDLVKDTNSGKILKREPQDMVDNARPVKKMKISHEQVKKDGEVREKDTNKFQKSQAIKKSNSESQKEKPGKFQIPTRDQSNKPAERVRAVPTKICIDNLGYIDPKNVESELKSFLGKKFVSIKFRSCEMFGSNENNKKLILGGWACLIVSVQSDDEIAKIIKDLNQLVWVVPNCPFPRPMVAHRPIFKDEDAGHKRNFFWEGSTKMSKRFYPGHNHIKLAMGPHFYQAGSLEWVHGAEWVSVQVQQKQIKSLLLWEQIYQIKEILQKKLKSNHNYNSQDFLFPDHRQFSSVLWLKNLGGDVKSEEIELFFKQYQNKWVDSQNQQKSKEFEWVRLVQDPVFGYVREAVVQMKSEATALSVMKDLTYMMACLEGPFRPICGQLAHEGGPTGFQSVLDTALQEIFNLPRRFGPIQGCKLCKIEESGFGEQEMQCAAEIQELLLGDFLVQKWQYVQQKRQQEMVVHNSQQTFFVQKQQLLGKLEKIFSNQKFKEVVYSLYPEGVAKKYPNYAMGSKRYIDQAKK